MDTKRRTFLETLYGFVHLMVHESDKSRADNIYGNIEHFVLWSEANGMSTDVRDIAEYIKEQQDIGVKLTYEEALAVHSALEHAHRTEAHRISYVASLEDASLTPTKLFDRLATAKRIMDTRRERVEEMGG